MWRAQPLFWHLSEMQMSGVAWHNSLGPGTQHCTHQSQCFQSAGKFGLESCSRRGSLWARANDGGGLDPGGTQPGGGEEPLAGGQPFQVDSCPET